MNAAIRELRRLRGYVAAAIVGIGAALAGLPWFADLAIGVIALLAGGAAATFTSRSTTSPRPTTNPPRPASSEPMEQAAATFRLEGQYWTIAYASSTFRLQDAKGLRYIHRLLTTPGVEVHVLDLTHTSRAMRPSMSLSDDEELRTDPPLRQPIIDEHARKAYRRRLEDLRDQIEEANAHGDDERAARAKQELEAITEQLQDAIRPGGSTGTIADETERARVNVSRAIRTSISKIAAQDRSLGHHLDREIRTGTYCSYLPDAATAPIWRL